MAGLLKSSTQALAEGGHGLIKKKSYLAECMFDALSGDERAWVGASLRVADCLDDVDIRALPCVSAACGRFAAPHIERFRAALVLQKARRGAEHRRTYWERVKDSRATRAIQKASRTIKGMRDTYTLGAASTLFKLASEELGPSVAACVEINQCVGCTRQFFTKSFLGDDVAVLAPSSGEEPASPRHRAGVASMAWRTTR